MMQSLFVSALIASICVDSQSNQDEFNRDEANGHVNTGALKVIGNIPRYGPAEMTVDDFDFGNEEYDWAYCKGVASVAFIPLVIAILSVLICPLWTLCRCRKCCCCKKTQPKKNVTTCSIYAPYFLVFASVVVISVMALIAYSANTDFSGQVLYNKGDGEQGNLYDIIETLMSDGVDKADVIQEITGDIKTGIIDAIDGVQGFLNDTDVLSTGSSSLISVLSSVSALWSNYSITTVHDGETYTFECEFCTRFSSEVAIISNQIEMQVGPIFSDLNSTVNEIDSSLIGIEAEIIAQVDVFIEQIIEVQSSLGENECDVEDSRTMIEGYNNYREQAYNVIFAIPLISIAFILLGGILKKPLCFSLSYVCLWFTCTMMWLLLAVHLPMAVLLNDACNFLDVAEQNFSAVYPQTGNVSVGEIFDACLADEGLTDTLGLGEFLNFTDQITFPSLGNISQEFQFAELIALENDAFAMDFTTFYVTGDAALVSINNLTANSPMGSPSSWDRSNVSELDSTAYYPVDSSPQLALEDLKCVLVVENQSLAAFSETVEQIQANLSAVSAQAASIEMDVQELVDNVDNASLLLNPLFTSVAEMESEARCGFIGDAYRDTKAVMCSAVLGSLSRIVVSMFVIAFLSLFACLCSVKLVRRVEWWHAQTQKKRKEQNVLDTEPPSGLKREVSFEFEPNQQKIEMTQQEGEFESEGDIVGHMPRVQIRPPVPESPFTDFTAPGSSAPTASTAVSQSKYCI